MRQPVLRCRSQGRNAEALVGELQSLEKVEGGRNPAWTRDELILALDLYLRYRPNPPGKSSLEIAELSKLLGRIGRVVSAANSNTFRNVNGVYMKLMNFRSLDPEYTKAGKVGLKARGRGDADVWNEFSASPERLAEIAAAIQTAVEGEHRSEVASTPDEPSISEAIEGRVLTRLHRVRERDRRLIEAKKTAVLKEFGELRCEACDANFSQAYHGLGHAALEVHHLRPLHTITGIIKTRLEDLAILCANCHRMVHASHRWRTVGEVRSLALK